MKQVIINETDWKDSIYRTVKWEQSVEIVRWEHDYDKKIYIINYKERNDKKFGDLEN